jgi:L-lactate dehydrogenase
MGLRVGIVGAGGVGVSTAWSILLAGLADRLTFYDRTADRARGEAVDFEHVLPLLERCELRGRGLDEIEPEDVLVIAAGRHVGPGETRLDLLDENLATVAETAADIERGGLPRIAIVVTSPLDVITEYLTRRWAGRAVSVFGSGTSLDTLRLAERIAVDCGVHPRMVHAWIIGEHGDSSVFLFESATIGSLDLATFASLRGLELGEEWRASVERDVRAAARQVRELKGSTTHAVGMAVGAVMRCIARAHGTILPVSVRVSERLCASVPCSIGPDGPGPPLMPAMSDAERAGWERSLDVLRAAGERIEATDPTGEARAAS